MPITTYDFWYDKVCVRFLEQIVRAFSGFSYQTGTVNGQAPQTVLVPCRMALSNQQVANIMANATENTAFSAPLITVYQTGLRGRREDLQNPAFIDRKQVFERKVQNGAYGPTIGNAYNVDRIMPLPFLMEISVDIWTSNLQQKYMLLEQILPVIYPQFEIQNSDNALDWTAVTVCVVDDDIQFTSKTIPVGTSADQIDVLSIHLKLPIWLSAPAKVKTLRRIEEIVTNIDQATPDPSGGLGFGGQIKQIVVSPDNACLAVNGQVLTLLGANGAETLADGSQPTWAGLFQLYGAALNPGVSSLNVYIDNVIDGSFIAGTIQAGTTANQLVWTPNDATLPANTLPTIDAVIDPHRSVPGEGLDEATAGQRYLLIADLGHSEAWGQLTAHTNDIIEYVNGAWTVVFSSQTTSSQQYVLNSFTDRQLRWTGQSWLMAVDGVYAPGFWRLHLSSSL